LGDVVDVRQGCATSNNFRFLRYWWEIDPNSISLIIQKDRKKWVPYAKEGHIINGMEICGWLLIARMTVTKFTL